MSSSSARSLQLGVFDSSDHPLVTLDLAPRVDRLGFSRYWLTEHPPQANPQLLVGMVCGLTDRIRVGTAGIAISFHNPLQAAENFLLLEHLFPGRIDAGFCAGGQPDCMSALLEGRPDPRLDPAAYEARVRAFLGYLLGEHPAGDTAAEVVLHRYGTELPEIWHFGTGPRSAGLAARYGTAFGYSIFHDFSQDGVSLMDRYRDEFRSSSACAEPTTALAVAGICAESEERARLLLRQTPYEAYTPNVVGTQAQCREQLLELASRYRTRELAFLDLCQRQADRVRSYELLSEAFQLIREPVDPPGRQDGAAP